MNDDYYEAAYESARKEIRRLHSVCREYNEENKELKRIAKKVIDLFNKVTEEAQEIPEYLLEELNIDDAMYKYIMDIN